MEFQILARDFRLKKINKNLGNTSVNIMLTFIGFVFVIRSNFLNEPNFIELGTIYRLVVE